MKRIALIATLAFLGAGVALWVAQSYMVRWEPRLRSELETRAGAALHARVHIESISISFIHRVALKDVEIWDTRQTPETLIFRAKEVALTVSLIDLPSAVYHRNPLELIGLITIDTPIVSLSPEWIAQHRAGKSTARSKPLWFAVEWNQGTFQWKDPQAPHGAWTLYHSKGFFRIRGPRINAAAQGSLEQAESVDLRLSSLGKRWGAQGRLTGGDIPAVLELVKHLTQHSPLPDDWRTQGRFNLDVTCRGRWPFQKSQGLGRYLQEAHLNLLEAQVIPGPDASPLKINGGLVFNEGRVETTAVSIKGEATQLKLSGRASPFEAVPEIDLQAQGHVGPWPVDNFHAQIRRLHDRWDIAPTTLRLCEGTLTLKGGIAPGQVDLALIGSDLSLQALTFSKFNETLKGRLNFSLSARGPAETLQTTGSFWISSFTWAHTFAESIRGDLDMPPTHFKLRGTSENEQIQIQAEGARSLNALTLQRCLLQLRDGTTLSGHGTFNTMTRRLRLMVDAKNVSLADDLPWPPTHKTYLMGHADLHGQLDGRGLNKEFKAEINSPDFQLSGSSPTSATASLRWKPQELTAEASFGKTPTHQGGVRFVLRRGELTVPHFSLATPYGKADLKGTASWEPPAEGKPMKDMTLQGEGHLASLNEGAIWDVPCRFKGHLRPSEGWSGDLTVNSPAVKVNRKASEAFEAEVKWTPDELRWDTLRWGRGLTSSGALHFGKDRAELSGELKARELDMATWQKLFWPQMKEPVRGTLNGSFSLSGSPQEPLLQFNGKVRHGIWRAFRFDTGIEGSWKKTGLDPFILNAALETGGQIHFQGRVSLEDQTASGALDITQFNLKPIGESLSFPHPLESNSNGTFTVSGPLNQLHFAGHVEGTSLVYGEPKEHPIHLESYVMDLKLEPAADQPHVTRLMITQAMAKTQEEEIRLNPGSFVDFAGLREARMGIGAEIRNLHLSVFTLFGGLDLNGTWRIEPQGFALQGDLFTRSLYINDYQLEQGHVHASYYNRLLSFEAPRNDTALVTGTVDFRQAPQLTFKNFAITGKERRGIQLTGQIGPRLWDFTLEGQGLDLNTLGGLAAFPYTLEGVADVKIRGRGDLEHPDVDGVLAVKDGRALGMNFREGSAAFAWRDQRMTFTRLQLSDPGRYTLTGTGVFPLASKTYRGRADKTIDFSLRLVDSNLGLLQSISSEVRRAEGSVQALLHMTGTTDAPVLKGSIRVKNGEVDGAHYFRHVSDYQMAADFDGDTLVISEFHAKSGKGEFTGGGTISFSGFLPKAYDLHLDIPTKGVEVTIPELAIPESPLAKRLKFLTTASQGDVKGHVTFRGPAEDPVFTAKAFISNGHFTFPPSSKNPPPPGFLEWIRRITWDTELHFADGAWFENELVEADLTGVLTIKGPSEKLKVDGGMDISEGKISYLGIDFNIRQARFDLRSTESGSVVITTPYVRGMADSQVQTVNPITGEGEEDTVVLTVNYAPISEIKPQLRSTIDPTLAQDKLLARVSQLEMEKLTPQERSYLYQQQMVRLIDTTLATPLARNVLKRTGLVDELRVTRVINPAANQLSDPNNPAAGQQNTAVNLFAGTKYTVAKNLSNRMSLGYGVRFEQIQTLDLENKLENKLDLRSDVELSYRFLSNVFLRGSFDLPSSTPGVLPDRKVTVEPRWRFGWWGNTNKPKPKPAPAPTGTNPPPPASQ